MLPKEADDPVFESDYYTGDNGGLEYNAKVVRCEYNDNVLYKLQLKINWGFTKTGILSSLISISLMIVTRYSVNIKQFFKQIIYKPINYCIIL